MARLGVISDNPLSHPLSGSPHNRNHKILRVFHKPLVELEHLCYDISVKA
jgi:hypothetical protein